jgi:hypothetical protein
VRSLAGSRCQHSDGTGEDFGDVTIESCSSTPENGVEHVHQVGMPKDTVHGILLIHVQANRIPCRGKLQLDLKESRELRTFDSAIDCIRVADLMLLSASQQSEVMVANVTRIQVI